MAVRTSSPWWLSAILAFGLVAVFVGERAFAHTENAAAATWLGVVSVLGATFTRFWVMRQTTGRQRRVELISLLCNLGTVLALVVYALSTDWGVELLGIDDEKSIHRYQISMMAIWITLLLLSLVPLLLIEISLGLQMREGFKVETEASDASVDLFRVKEMASSGLSIALASTFLIATCSVAAQRSIRKDVTYFKTTSPGSATVNMVSSLSEPLKVMIFFPEVNEVADQVEAYFDALAAETDKVAFERRDRLVDAALATEHKIHKDGTILLLRGDKTEKLTLNTDFEKASKTELRELDSKIQKALMKVIRDRRTAYLSVGHGELNDPETDNPLVAANPLGKSTLITEALRQLNYQVKDFQGLGRPVPDDCDLLFVLAPSTQLLDEELRAIDDYLAQGGAAIISLDPGRAFSLGLLESRLGVHFDSAPLADDKEFMARTRTQADHGLILTNQFSSHASITNMSRGKAQAGILLVRPGSLVDVPFGANKDKAKKTFVVRSMASAFRDLADDAGSSNFVYDKDTEKRDRYNLVASIEDESALPAKLEEGEKHNGMRAMVIADGEIFSDAMLSQIPLVQALFVDAVKWVGGEEAYQGDTESEKDVRIEQTKSQDAAWFWSTMVGAPVLVLAFGLGFVSMIRRRSRRK